MDQSTHDSFCTFVEAIEPRLRRALVAAYGFEQGREATAEGLAWAWEHWDRVQSMGNQVPYLYRVGQSKIRERKVPVSFAQRNHAEPWFEPALAPALSALTERQRMAVVLIHGFEWTMREVADLMEVQVTSVQTHLERGLAKLRAALEVPDNA